MKKRRREPFSKSKLDPKSLKPAIDTKTRQPIADRSLLLDTFPKNVKFREFQQEALLAIADAFNSGYKTVFLVAPCGLGKTLILATHGAHSKNSYYAVGLKSLQDQILKDPILKKFKIAGLKGRSNYRCYYGGNAQYGLCSFDQSQTRRCIKENRCRYERAKARAIKSKMTCVNIALLLSSEFLTRRELLILDEAHQLESLFLNQVSMLFTPKDNIPLPEKTRWAQYLEWLKDYRKYIQLDIPYLTEDLKDLEGKIMATKNLERRKKLDRKYRAIIREIERLKGIKKNIDLLLEDYKKNKEEWVVQLNPQTNYVTFQPISVERFYKPQLFSKGKRVIVSSATPPFPEELGLEPEQVKILEYPSVFPIPNRPVYYGQGVYSGSMSLKNRDGTFPEMAKKIAQLSKRKTIVHCGSYTIATKLSEELNKFQLKYLLQDRRQREQSLKQWINQSKITLFLSVNMEDGISLDDDLARINIVAKIPFPHLGDLRIRKRMALVDGERWYLSQAIRKVQQAAGRTTRSKKDWSHTFILDSDFDRLIKNHDNLFFKWFKDALRRKDIGETITPP
ncbi:MAG: helicase C-terminal domain-containing protein [Candidatus Hodarchaeota archaeon]